MTLAARLDILMDDAEAAMLAAMHRAYELGYREALANVRRSDAPSDSTPVVETPSTAEVASPPAPSPTADPTLPPIGTVAITRGASPAHVATTPEPEPARPASRVDWGPDDEEDEYEHAAQGDATEPWIAESSHDEVGEEVEEPADDDAEVPRRVHGVLVKPILPHATVGKLRDRIVEVFGLERYDIEVKLYRKSGGERQLKASVRLRKYLLQG
ncbi:MAG: hypothetical protein IT373_28645 [Polyangiaceae bacterium]|nr:hypothetical protein [Polyangiaceae bacterium]